MASTEPAQDAITEKPCEHIFAPGFQCDGVLVVMESLKYEGTNLVYRSAPWVQCTNAQYCKTYKKYKPEEWSKPQNG